MPIRFSSDEVARLISLASSAARGRTLAERLAESYGGMRRLIPYSTGNVFVVEPARDEGEVLHVEGITTRDLEDYVRYYRFVDPMSKFLFSALNQVKTLSDAASPREVDRSEYSDLLGRSKVGVIAGWSQSIGGGRYVAAAFHRPKGHEDFAPRERALLRVVMPFMVATAREHLVHPSPFETLTRAERAVAELVMRGCPDRAIAAHLGVGFATVRTHLQRTFTKLRVSNRTELVHALIQGVPSVALDVVAASA